MVRHSIFQIPKQETEKIGKWVVTVTNQMLLQKKNVNNMQNLSPLFSLKQNELMTKCQQEEMKMKG